MDFTNESCFDLLPRIASESVDLILIDPPYLVSRPSGFTNTTLAKYKTHSIDFGEWDYKLDGFDDIIGECYRVLKKGGTFICFYDLWKITPLAQVMTAVGFKQHRFLEWVKTNPVPINQSLNYLSNAREIAVLGVKGGKPTFHGKYDNGIYRYPIEHDKGRFHPTQKNLDLITALVEKHSNPGDLVLDCFAGSATTGVAALQLLRRFVGCEIDPNFYAQALARLQAVTYSSSSSS